jgi:hypothetical protein
MNNRGTKTYQVSVNGNFNMKNKDTQLISEAYQKRVLNEGTWQWIDTEESLEKLRRFFDQHRSQQNGGDDLLSDILGDDTLSDDIYVDEEKYGEDYDLRRTLISFFSPANDDWKSYMFGMDNTIPDGETKLEKEIPAWRFIMSIPNAKLIYKEMQRGTDSLGNWKF